MKIWLITIGEPIPHPGNKLRLHRTGILAKQISEAGKHEVTWWTSAFNHFTKEHIFEADTRVKVNDNLTMIALKGIGYKRNISIQRIKDHQQITEKFIKLTKAESKPDILVAAFPTLGLCGAAILYGKQNNIPVLIDYRDMWPEVFVDILPLKLQTLGKLALFHLFSKTRKVFAEATGIIGITDQFLNIALSKVRRERIPLDGVFPLGYLENQFTETELAEAVLYWQNKGLANNVKRICFFGTLGYQFDLETVIKAAHLPNTSSYEFILCGTGDKVEELKKLNDGHPNVVFPGYMSAAQIKALMLISDYGLCPYIPKEAFLNSIPGKAIEYFSSGLPIVTTLGAGTLGQFVTSHEIGVNYEAFNSESLLDSLKNLDNIASQKMKLNISELYNVNFSSETVYSKYLNHVEKVASLIK